MKGLTHFVVGIAVATCFPLAVRSSFQEASFIIILGGIFGILPDTLDFRFSRYIEKHDYEAEPGIDKPDPRKVTDMMIKAIEECDRTGRTVKVKLHTMKISADLWRRYSVTIDAENKKIITKMGPLVTTGQEPMPGTEPLGEEATAEGTFRANLLHTYEKETFVDIFSGPDFAFIKEKDKVLVEFIPWHRRWSHSLTIGALFAPFGLLLYGMGALGLVASAIIVLAFYAHIFVDQIGMLGSNLFYPFSRKRSKGFGAMHSGDSLSNFITNYISILIVVWNLNSYAPKPAFQMDWVKYLNLTGSSGYWIGLLNYITYFMLIPLSIIYCVVHIYKKRYQMPVMTKEEAVAEESLREIEEIISR